MLKIILKNAFKIFSVAMLCSNVSSAKEDNVKAKEQDTIVSQVDDMLDDFAFLKDEAKEHNITKHETHKPPFIWPIHMKFIKQIVRLAPNCARIDTTQSAYVMNMHTGLVLSANLITKTIIVKHIVEGGVCYVTTLTNVDHISTKVGDIIKIGAIVGTTNSLTIEVRQLNIQILPSIDMLFPPINSDLVKVVRHMKNN